MEKERSITRKSYKPCNKVIHANNATIWESESMDGLNGLGLVVPDEPSVSMCPKAN